MGSRAWARFAWLLALLLVLAGCSGAEETADPAGAPAESETETASPTEPESESSSPEADRWTQEEVTAATAPNEVRSVYAVPKDLKEDYRLAWINPNLGFPFFKTYSDGYKAAAEFYGVELYEADLGNFNFAAAVDTYEQLSAKQPQVVGILTPSGQALYERTKADGVVLLPSGIPIPENPYFIGTDNVEAGRLGGELLGEQVAQLMDGEWAGRDLVYVGLAQSATQVTVERVEGGLTGVRQSLPDLPDASTFFPDLGQSATAEDGLRVMSDFLTAHPDEVVAVVVMNDEAGSGALQAVRQAGRSEDVRIVLLGGDELGRSAIRESSDVVVGAVDFNPFGGGWRWVETAIAILEGDEYDDVPIDRVLTPENVDEFYPND